MICEIEKVAPARDLSGIAVGESSGYAKMRPGDIGGFDELRSACLALFELRREEALTSGKKGYLRPVLREQDFLAHPEIALYALNDMLLRGAADYLDAPPALRSVQLFWTAPNETTQGSQMFHFDHDGRRQLKLFAYLNDVGDAEGPFSFLPADASERVKSDIEGRGGRYTDEAVFAACDANDLIVLQGPAGAGGLVDTTRCLHFGGRARGGERLLVIVQYVRSDDDFDATGALRPTFADAAALSSFQRSALRMMEPAPLPEDL